VAWLGARNTAFALTRRGRFSNQRARPGWSHNCRRACYVPLVRDPYELLEVRRDATADELKAAFRRAAIKHHPDRNPGDAEAQVRFAEINRAYQILADPEHRAEYDRFGAAAFERDAASTNGISDYVDLSSIDGVIGDILGAFGIKSGERRKLEHRMEVSFEHAALGVTQEIRFARLDHCKTCKSSGAAPGTPLTDCRNCGGRGKIRSAQGLIPIPLERACPACFGRGKIAKTPCVSCRGRGLTQQTRTLEVTLPAGVEHGTTRQIQGEGHRTKPGGEFSDLEIQIVVTPHRLFEREGDDVRCRVPISFVQATLGGEISVPTLTGQAKVRVPRTTQSGSVLRLRGQGVGRKLRGGRGDQLIEVFVEVPAVLSQRARELLVLLGDELGEAHEPQQHGFMDKLKDLFG